MSNFNTELTSISINNRDYSELQPEAETAPPCLFDLSYLCLIDVAGDSSSDFLQGQFSCDVNQVTAKQMQRGALCTLKGRVICLTDIIFADHYSLVLADDISQRTLNKLNKVALFSKVSLKKNQHHVLLGLNAAPSQAIEGLPVLPQAPQAVQVFEHGLIYHKQQNFYVLVLTAEKAQNLWMSFAAIGKQRGSAAWHSLMLQQSLIEIYPQSQGVFLPHRIGLVKNNYINFEKGCYVGQEIIARTEYLAKLKYDLFIYRINAANCPSINAEVVADGKKIGEVVDVAQHSAGNYLLALSLLKEHPMNVRIEAQEVELIP